MTTKTCTKCGETKSLAEFHRKAGGAQGRNARCKACHCEVQKTRYAVGGSRQRAQARAWARENRERKNANAAAWAKRNRWYTRASWAKYNATKLQATPAWANNAYITLFYKLAKIEEDRTGRKVHVDHIVPLQGEAVCGLHCEDNLQLMFSEDNYSKGNRLAA